jgi:protein tyrosine/serine phosphatase
MNVATISDSALAALRARNGAKSGWRHRRLRLALAVIMALVGLPVLGMGGWALGLQMVGNIHVVEAGQVYRSAQLNGPALEDVLARYGIRTVLNLRGVAPGQGWYDDEIAVSQARGVVHIDVPMSASQLPDEATTAKLIQVLRDAPGPILIHCQSGADRTGLASALYELLVAHKSAALAGEQLSFRYGHFPWLGSRTEAMDDAFERIASTVH